jgi:hypothetical protein
MVSLAGCNASFQLRISILKEEVGKLEDPVSFHLGFPELSLSNLELALSNAFRKVILSPLFEDLQGNHISVSLELNSYAKPSLSYQDLIQPPAL